MKVIFKNSTLKFEKGMTQVYLTPYETLSTSNSINATTGNFNVSTGAMPLKFYDVSQFAGQTLNIQTVLRYVHGTSSTATFGVFYSTRKTSAEASNNVLSGGISVLNTEATGLSFEAGYNGSSSNTVVSGEITIPSNAVSLAIQGGTPSAIGVDVTNDIKASYFG